MFVAIVAALALVSSSTSQIDNPSLPHFTLPARVNSTTGQVCPPNEVRMSERNKIHDDVQDLLQSTSCLLLTTESKPAASCSALPTSCPSGYYWVRSSNGSAVQVYCDMNRVCGCNDTGGWTRVAFLNMTDPNQQCPSGWTFQSRHTEPRRLCTLSGSVHDGCSSATFSTHSISYSHVCGRVLGYQFFGNAFYPAFLNESVTIDDYYVTGVSLTHGPLGARQHIWTFATGRGENYTIPVYACPCANRPLTLAHVPTFVENDFFCESGNPLANSVGGFYANDTLWDGQGCGSPPCCELSYPPGVTAPWFCKQLSQTTTDNIEARICGGYSLVEFVELYIR